YYPAFQTEKNYRAKVENIVSSYIMRQNKAYEENGYKFSKEKRTNIHYTWFVYYHVLGWTFDEIANNFSINKAATVSKEVNYIYDFIGINRGNRKKK
ncbi:hypothetical protein V7075_11005, partial [Neobacillus drentensis]|uniref:hypothetical protein n=1 Tax=Neobacillus drentensis TaxID=220684 RepID=UPI0030008B18